MAVSARFAVSRHVIEVTGDDRPLGAKPRSGAERAGMNQRQGTTGVQHGTTVTGGLLRSINQVLRNSTALPWFWKRMGRAFGPSWLPPPVLFSSSTLFWTTTPL